MGSRSKKIRVHVAKIDIKSNNLKVIPHSVNKYASTLGSLIDFDLVNPKSYVSINASFFQSGTNLPVGITALNNEILQIRKYKNWSSIIFDNDSIFFKELEAESNLLFDENIVPLDRYNYRTDTNQIVIYNSLYTKEFPILEKSSIDSMYINFLIENNMNTLAGDETEPPISFSEFSEIYKNTYQYDSMSYNYVKLIPVSDITLNDTVTYIAKNENTFPIHINSGESLLESKIKLPIFNNDTIRVITKFNIEKENINHIISTTPIILKDGKEFINSRYEGATSRRFNYDHLPRSAFGFNNESYFLVSVEPNQGRRVKGATIKELSWIMETIGAKNAINLDGGGSTCFIVNGKNLTFNYNQDYVRNVSTGISIFNTK